VTSPWEGVRNYEARNLMKEMKVGEKVNPSRRVSGIDFLRLLWFESEGTFLPFELQNTR
jgi:hypothetical protein